jgi:hypothetical protein
MRRIYRALNLTAFAESQTLDGIRREEHIDRLWRIISLRGTQKSEALFGHLEPAFHDDRLSLWLRRIAAPIFTPVFTRATLVALVALVAALAALAAALIITPLLVVTAITSTALAAAAAALIVALPLMATVSLMVTTMTTSTTTATTLTEATLATARTEGTLMALLTLRPALLGISLKPGGIASTGAGVTRVGAVGRLR